MGKGFPSWEREDLPSLPLWDLPSIIVNQYGFDVYALCGIFHLVSPLWTLRYLSPFVVQDMYPMNYPSVILNNIIIFSANSHEMLMGKFASSLLYLVWTIVNFVWLKLSIFSYWWFREVKGMLKPFPGYLASHIFPLVFYLFNSWSCTWAPGLDLMWVAFILNFRFTNYFREQDMYFQVNLYLLFKSPLPVCLLLLDLKDFDLYAFNSGEQTKRCEV